MALAYPCEPAWKQLVAAKSVGRPARAGDSAANIAQKREDGGGAEQQGPCWAPQFLAERGERSVAGFAGRHHRHVSELDEEIEKSGRRQRRQQRTRDVSRGIAGLAGRDDAIFEADEGIEDEQSGRF